MADIEDLVVEQNVFLSGIVVAIDPDDRHFQGVSIRLSNPETGYLHNQIIKADPSQITID